QAVRAGNYLFLSTLTVQNGDLAARGVRHPNAGDETERLLENAKGICESAGYRLQEIVRARIALRNLADWPEVDAMFKEVFGEKLPAVSVLGVGNQFVIPLFQKGGVAKRTSGSEKTGRGIVDAPGEDPGSSKATSGRKRQARPGTLYAGSTPAGARIFCIKANEAPPEGRIHRARNVTTCANEICKPRGYGVFVVEVAIPVRHPELRLGPGYLDFRRKLKNATKDKLRQQAAEEYFIPDGSVLLVDRAEGQEYIVRQYRNIELRRDRATVVNALFLPRIPRASGRGYSIDELIKDAFIPVGEKYAFNVADVTSELQSIYEIDQPERDAIVEALRRIGAISFTTYDGKTRLFKIDPQTGWLAVDEITDPIR
ncbi:MAG: RidA family protein, partial [Planctomycetes bacterium]|nr:RidA family protein [Planctomycetota bacterium]